MTTRHTFYIDFKPGSPLAVEMRASEAPVTLPEVLPALFSIADSLVQRTVEACAANHATPTCAKGCSTCCSLMVPISEAEGLHLSRLVRRMPEPQRTVIIERFQGAVTRMETSGLLEDIMDGFRNHAGDALLLKKLAEKYWELAIPCPFLEDDACSIHPQRPLICRQYLMLSDPARCCDPFAAQHGPHPVRHTYDPAGALASFDGQAMTRTSALPLSLSLLLAPSLERRQWPEVPPATLVHRWLNCMATGFSSDPVA